MKNTGLYNEHGRALSLSEIMDMLPIVVHLEKVTRVEVIDQNGRSYVNWDKENKTEISIQDSGRTLQSL